MLKNMLSYSTVKVYGSKLLVVFFLLTTGKLSAQSDSLPYSKYSDKIVLYTDLGFSTAPFRIAYPYTSAIEKIKYRNNMSAVWGFGVCYKWFALRLGIALPGTIKPVSQYGRTQYYDLGFDFTLKRTFFDVDLHVYNGYAIKNAYRWNDSLNGLKPHDIRPDVNSASFSINAWIFKNKGFKMSAFRGKTASYRKDLYSFYLKPTFNVHGVSSNSNKSLIPVELIDSNQTKTLSRSLVAVDLGIVPGMVYVKRWNDFQIGIMGGMGLVVQSKFFTTDSISRNFLGLAPRFDVKFIASYNQPRYFVLFVSDFDNKSFRFNNFAYRQTYYNLKIVAGMRFNKKKKKKPEENDPIKTTPALLLP